MRAASSSGFTHGGLCAFSLGTSADKRVGRARSEEARVLARSLTSLGRTLQRTSIEERRADRLAAKFMLTLAMQIHPLSALAHVRDEPDRSLAHEAAPYPGLGAFGNQGSIQSEGDALDGDPAAM